MDELEMIKERLKKKHHNNIRINVKNPSNHYMKKAFTRVLLAIIFVLSSLIYINLSNENLEKYKKTVFETNWSFAKVNEWYEQHFGKVLPIDLTDNTVAVSKPSFDFQKITKYQDGVRVEVAKESIIHTINSGIVVFMGEKEGYGNVLIVQGVDGVDIWYGNITNVNLSLYDYVEKNSILGSAKDDHIYFVLKKDGQYLDYEEYQKQI